MKYYTGVGSRKVPSVTARFMRELAVRLNRLGYILRSGGAEGADSAFEVGAGEKKEIWRADDATQEAMDIAARYHGAWHLCSDYAKKLHGRNAFQVLGRDLITPSEFVICWTPDGITSHADRTIKTGGTGTAISIASEHGIPVYNLNNKESTERFKLFARARCIGN